MTVDRDLIAACIARIREQLRHLSRLESLSREDFLASSVELPANNLPCRDGLARTATARDETEKAIDIYRRLNQPDITATWTSVLEPRFVLAVARLARQSGDRETARAEYARFLALWKNADEGLPELAEARRYQ